MGVDPSGLLLAPHRRGDDDALIHLGTADPEAACQVVEQLVRMMDKRIRILLERGLDSVPKCVHRRAFPLFLIVFEELPANRRIYDLRHTFATLAIGKGVDLATISKYMGHADVSVTSRNYVHYQGSRADLAALVLLNGGGGAPGVRVDESETAL